MPKSVWLCTWGASSVHDKRRHLLCWQGRRLRKDSQLPWGWGCTCGRSDEEEVGLRVRSLGPTPMRGVSQGECYKAHRRDQQRYAGRTRGSREMARITSHGCEVAQVICWGVSQLPHLYGTIRLPTAVGLWTLEGTELRAWAWILRKMLLLLLSELLVHPEIHSSKRDHNVRSGAGACRPGPLEAPSTEKGTAWGLFWKRRVFTP